jgi:hypothetical protein
VYYTNFEVLHDWAKLPFYRRWRRTREIKKEQILARMKNTLLCSQARLPPMSNLRNRTRQLDLSLQDRKLVAWGNGNFGMRRGQAPMPNKGLRKYVARFVPVILVPEHGTSKTCLCDRATEPYRVSNIVPKPHCHRSQLITIFIRCTLLTNALTNG